MISDDSPNASRPAPGSERSDRRRPRVGAPVLPREHGVWAMIIAPWLVAVGVVGVSAHAALLVALLVAALAGTLACAALLEHVRKAAARRTPRELVWCGIYTIAAGASAAPVVAARPLVLLAVAGAAIALPVEWVYLSRRDERALANGFVSLFALTLTGPAALVLAAPQLDARLLALWAICLAFFALSLLFVRSLLRARKSRAFAVVALALHAVLPLAFVLAGMPLLAAALAPSFARAAALSGRKLSPKQIGLVELANTLVFVVLAVLALRTR